MGPYSDKDTSPSLGDGSRPNIIVILNDDMGFSDLGCYGGEINTPNLDRLASGGLRFSQFYNTARCCPSRASLLTGLHPHQADVGHMTDDDGIDGYLGDLNPNTVTIAEALGAGGYRTYMSGKWHVTRHISPDGPNHNWPCQRGFDSYYGILTGASSYFHPKTLTRNNKRIDTPPGEYYLTDAISDEAVIQVEQHALDYSGKPFFQYVAYTAPHWPLHAHPEDIENYRGRFDRGWDKLREERMERLVSEGIIQSDWQLSPRDQSQTSWGDAEDKAWQVRRMEVYAAQIECMDRGIGRIIEGLEVTGQLENTLIIFLADNGGCAEELPTMRTTEAVTPDGRVVQMGNDRKVMPGSELTYQTYGVPWANVSNTPFREYKHWVHEGGIATPFIAHWPQGISDSGSLRHKPAQLPDIMATCLDIAKVNYPETFRGQVIQPHEGYSLASVFTGGEFEREVLTWEHEGNRAVRKGRWKLVTKYPGGWELYDIERDRTELKDLSSEHPEVVKELSGLYQHWADRCGVKPWDEILELRKEQGRA